MPDEHLPDDFANEEFPEDDFPSEEPAEDIYLGQEPELDFHATPPSRVSLSTKLATAFLFALFGGLAVLMSLPVTHSFYTRILYPSPADRSLAVADRLSRGHPLPWPDSPDRAALWLSIAARRVMTGGVLKPEELSDLQTIANRNAELELDNGYWNQAAASFALDAGHPDLARDLWIKASRKLSWNSHETSLLLQPFGLSDNIPGAIVADLADLRNESVVSHIQVTAAELLAANWNDPKWSTAVRAATVLNGELIRSHARSLQAMNSGIATSDLALIRPGTPAPSGHHLLLVARLDLEREAKTAKLDLAGHDLERAFSEGDSAAALTTREDTRWRRNFLSTQAAIIDCLPGATFLAASIALILVLLRLFFKGIQFFDSKVPWLGTSVAAGLTLILALREVPNFVALAMALSIVFCGSTPVNVRKARPFVLGRLHDAFTGFFALALVVAATAFILLSKSPDALRLRTNLGAHFDWHASGIGLIGLLLVCVLLTAPLWAFAQRLPTVHVLDVSLTRLARSTAVLALFFAVILGPVCLIMERNIQPQLFKIFTNEPIYYLSR